MKIKRAIHDEVTHEDAKYTHFTFDEDEAGNPKRIRVTFPNSVLKIDDVSDLHEYLDRYSNQVSWKEECPDSEFGRRWYVEKIRPTLRFYCKKYSVPIPPWLVNDDYFLKMEPQAKHKLFGPEELEPIEFKKFKPTTQDPNANH